tara:strand:+ start:7775 stop:8122 length:348 start_codon:yes stop_codon:yes gene_type:complete
MLFSTEPAGGCSLLNGFLLAPLPAHKRLWEARSESQWILEKSRDQRGDSVFGIKMGGTMVKLNKHQAPNTSYDLMMAQSEEPVESESESSANWLEWCSGIDGLGALVMLAASLPT